MDVAANILPTYLLMDGRALIDMRKWFVVALLLFAISPSGLFAVQSPASLALVKAGRL